MDDDNNDQVEDEYQALLAIYGEAAVSCKYDGARIVQISIKIDVAGRGHCLLRAAIPQDYPDALPQLGVYADFFSTGQQRIVLAELLGRIENETGLPVLFSCVTFLQEAMQASFEQHQVDDQNSTVDQSIPERAADLTPSIKTNISAPPLQIVHGDIIIDRKSVFQAHCAFVYSKKQVEQVVSSLLENSKVANATHNMIAYRLRSADTRNALVSDCDDDGEKAAGKHILQVLEMLGCENLLVVVSRWYGGTPLGPVRFKHIANATRQVVLTAQRPSDEKK